jgi:hypothetical protein
MFFTALPHALCSTIGDDIGLGEIPDSSRDYLEPEDKLRTMRIGKPRDATLKIS